MKGTLQSLIDGEAYLYADIFENHSQYMVFRELLKTITPEVELDGVNRRGVFFKYYKDEKKWRGWGPERAIRGQLGPEKVIKLQSLKWFFNNEKK